MPTNGRNSFMVGWPFRRPPMADPARNSPRGPFWLTRLFSNMAFLFHFIYQKEVSQFETWHGNPRLAIFHFIYGIIIPLTFIFFQRGRSTTNQKKCGESSVDHFHRGTPHGFSTNLCSRRLQEATSHCHMSRLWIIAPHLDGNIIWKPPRFQSQHISM